MSSKQVHVPVYKVTNLCKSNSSYVATARVKTPFVPGFVYILTSSFRNTC